MSHIHHVSVPQILLKPEKIKHAITEISALQEKEEPSASYTVWLRIFQSWTNNSSLNRAIIIADSQWDF